LIRIAVQLFGVIENGLTIYYWIYIAQT